MKLYDYLRTQTSAEELCTITEGGWIVATAWIDHEDLFSHNLPRGLANKEVVKAKFSTLIVRDESHSTKDLETVVRVPVRTVEVE